MSKAFICKAMAFLVVTTSLILVGVVCLAKSLELFAAGQTSQALALDGSFLVLLLGSPSAAVQLAKALTYAIPSWYSKT